MNTKDTEALNPRQRAELTEPDPPRLDVLFGTLQNQRRRRILRYLENESSATIGELAEHIAAIENDVPKRQLSSTQRKRVYVSLYQSHLSKLADTGAVCYNKDRGTVELTDKGDDFLKVLHRCEGTHARPAYLPTVYSLLGVVVLGTVLLMMSTMILATNVGPFVLGVVGTLTLGALITGVVVIVTHAYDSQVRRVYDAVIRFS